MTTITLDMEQENVHMAFIATTIEVILAEAKEQQYRFTREAINWGDLSCADVQITINRKGEKRYLVTIEEAAPYCEKLIAFVHAGLQKHKFEDIDVITEW